MAKGQQHLQSKTFVCCLGSSREDTEIGLGALTSSSLWHEFVSNWLLLSFTPRGRKCPSEPDSNKPKMCFCFFYFHTSLPDSFSLCYSGHVVYDDLCNTRDLGSFMLDKMLLLFWGWPRVCVGLESVSFHMQLKKQVTHVACCLSVGMKRWLRDSCVFHDTTYTRPLLLSRVLLLHNTVEN